MYQFVTWIIEYSDDDRLARVFFIAAVPLLLLAKLFLSIGDGFRSLGKRRTPTPVFAVGGSPTNQLG
jgi:hypothetical protein